MQSTKTPRTCDQCRMRKIRCVDNEKLSVSCEGCHKLSITCTHEYVRKKPGRKHSLISSPKATQKTQQPEGLQTRINYSLGISSYPARTEQRSSTSPTGYRQPIRIENITHRGEQSSSSRIAEDSSAAQAAVSSTLSPLISSGANATISWLDSILDDTAIPLVSSANLGVIRPIYYLLKVR
ncbi:hypothetical protein V865_001861 [Kwoniella europaea PYCC6329]|uniref:Zn(2)-C6 fungal-type domain-containing protein n=1 Tax=Kwoniella europaea PYCC6329 TaxID=1423913 RepID=A0AAX4KE59_9TREE